ncbi:MAG: hypothetical protein ACT6QS_09115 [Flavobacteriales bacterium]
MKMSRFSALMLSILFTAGWLACDPKQKDLEPEACPDSVHFIKYQADGYAWADRPHFSTPDGRWFRVYKNQLLRVSPQSDEAAVYEADGDIIVPSLRVLPNGSIFFMDGWTLYHVDAAGNMHKTADTYAGVTVPFSDVWNGTAFVTPEGNYGYADRDGDGIRVNIRSAATLAMLQMASLPDVPQGDCLGAYFDDNKYTFIHHFTFQGTVHVWRYRFYKQGNTIYRETKEVQIPEETKSRDWQNFRPDGNGYATFDIYEEDVVHHYRIDVEQEGPYTILPDTPRYIEAPDGYYRFAAEGSPGYPCVLRVSKYSAAGSLIWERKIPTGQYLLHDTYGWANSEGVYLVSGYFPETSSGSGSVRVFISAGGVVCD